MTEPSSPPLLRWEREQGGEGIVRPSLLNRRTLAVALAGLAVVLSLAQAGFFSRDLVNEGGWPLAWRFFQAALTPELSRDFIWLAVDATLKTLAFAVCGTALSLIIGLVGGVLSSEAWWAAVRPPRTGDRAWLGGRAPWLAIRSVLALPRAIHEIIWGLFFVNILGLDPLTAVLAIGIPFGAIVAKVYSELLDETPRAPLHALLHSGVPPLTAFTYSLLPQAWPNLLSYAFYRFECSIRSAAALGIIGAGGLGYQLLLSFQSLRYNEMWTFLYALILLSGVVDVWSSLLRQRIGLTNRIDLNLREAGPSDLPPSPPPLVGTGEKKEQAKGASDPVVRGSVILVLLLLPFSFWYIGANWGRLVAPRTFSLLVGVFQDAFPPSLTGIENAVNLTLQTLGISIIATAVAGMGGILFSFPAAGNFFRPGGLLDPQGRAGLGSLIGLALLVVSRLILLVTRAIPPPVWALLLLFVLFPGPLPGALALGLYTFGILGRLKAEVVEDLDERPLRALLASGASAPAVFLYGVLPDTMPRFLAYIFYRWEVAARETVIIGVVGAGGLGRLLQEQLSSFAYRQVLTTLLLFLVLTFVVDILSVWARRALR